MIEELARAWGTLGEGLDHTENGRVEQAHCFDQGLAYLQQLIKQAPGNVKHRRSQAVNLMKRGEVSVDDKARGLTYITQGVAGLKALSDENPDNVRARREYAVSLLALGVAQTDAGDDAVGDRPMSGLYARPAGAAPKSLPAIITLEGAGVYPTRTEPWLINYAKDGFISLELNAHGLPNGRPPEYYLALEKGSLKDYQLAGRTSRDTYYFLNMFLRDLRGIDFLNSQPEWNGRVLIANGTSQGGAQAIFLAAEDARGTFLVALVPGMCDTAGMLGKRIAGWPKLVPATADGKPNPAVLTTSRYFDAVNLATRIRVPVLFVAGFVDQTAPPTSVYAAYNNVPSEKEMHPATCSPHGIEPAILQEVRRRVLLKK